MLIFSYHSVNIFIQKAHFMMHFKPQRLAREHIYGLHYYIIGRTILENKTTWVTYKLVTTGSWLYIYICFLIKYVHWKESIGFIPCLWSAVLTINVVNFLPHSQETIFDISEYLPFSNLNWQLKCDIGRTEESRNLTEF